MKRLVTLCTAAVLGTVVLSSAGQVWAQAPAAGGGGNGPIDATSDSLETIDTQHLLIYHDNVEVLQNGNRLVCDKLQVFFTGKPATGPRPAKSTPSSTSGGVTQVGSDWGSVDHMIAEGHVYFVGQNQTARGEHAFYDMAPDVITMTGDVVVVQGDNVARGDKLVIQVKTGHSEFFSNVTGRNKPGRVRTVIYNDGQTAPSSSPPSSSPPSSAAQAPAAPPAPAPAKH